MQKRILFPLWVIVLIVGLPQLSETMLTPALPEIANSLNTTIKIVQQTLSISLLGMAFGTILWGTLSDKIGRKTCVLIGISVFIVGCTICFIVKNIELFMIGRFIQATGGSIGIVLGQTILRDVFANANLGKVFSGIGIAAAVFQAIGPIFGGFLVEQSSSWCNICLYLIGFSFLLFLIVVIKLPETLNKQNKISIKNVFKKLICDKRVMLYSLVVGCTNGITFGYLAEGSFFMIELLHMSPSNYGMSFIFYSAMSVLGGILSYKLQTIFSPKRIIILGITIVFISNFILYLIVMYIKYMPSSNTMIYCSVILQMCTRLGIAIVMSNSTAQSLIEYKDCIGTASSIFGLFFYILTSFFTAIISILHNGSLTLMPAYFTFLSILMFAFIYKIKNA